jgi:flagellar assembly protein FliH
MMRSAALSGPALSRWQFPDLDPRVAECPLVPAEAESDPPTIGRDTAGAPASPPRDLQAEREALAAATAQGYAEGYARGSAEGSDKGYADGFARGELAGRQVLAEEARRLTAIGERLAAPMSSVERVIEDALVGLALELARMVIGGEIARSRDSLVGLIREALARAPLRMAGLRIALHPADLDLVRTLAPEIEAGGGRLIADKGIEEGGCLILVDDNDGRIKDRRWHPRPAEGAPHIDLSLAARWRSAMLALFDGESA